MILQIYERLHDVLESEPWRRTRLWEHTHRVTAGFRALGFELGETQTPVIPVIVGDTFGAAGVWRALFDDGIFTHPIVPPAVPEHSCRIRVSMSAEHTDAQVDRVLSAFERVSHMIPRREPSAAAIAT